MKQGLGKFAMAMTAIFILADSANSEPVYNPLHFEFSEICQEGQDVLECTDRLMRMADNLLSGRSGLEFPRDYLLNNPDFAAETAGVIPQLMQMAADEISELRDSLPPRDPKGAWVGLFYAQTNYIAQVAETRFLLMELAKRQFLCGQGLVSDERTCRMLREAGTGDAEFLAQRIGYMEALLAERTVEFDALVEHYLPE